MSKASNSKKAVVLFNLGGPDKQSSVRPFLFNLFNDKYIITLPQPFRWVLAFLISTLRNKTAQHIYSLMGGGSTILPETRKQAQMIQEGLSASLKGSEAKVFVCMRHWHPMTEEVVRDIVEYHPGEIILLPLYPQYSTTTTASSIECFLQHKNNFNLKNIPIKTICCYPEEPNFIKSHVEKIKTKIKDLENYRILFSAHGLPKKIIDKGDPYQWQIEECSKQIIKGLGGGGYDHLVTYQSKVGPMEWLTPNTEDEILKAAKEGKNLVIVPIAFVSEHSETLVELDIEYKDLIKDYGIKYLRVSALSADSLFIDSMVSMVKNALNKKDGYCGSSTGRRLCPESFSKCPSKI
ncbi:MAG: hypothetical protein DGJ47_000107 [Rickettsiaceae bacterium]